MSWLGRRRLKTEMAGVDYDMAARELVRMFSDGILKKDLARLLDRYLENPCFERAAEIIELNADFLSLFGECRPGGVVELQERTRLQNSAAASAPSIEPTTFPADALHFAVSKSDIERADISSTLQALERVLCDRAHVLQFRDSVSIFVDGYDTDPRELHEVLEVRRFFRELDRSFPYWFYFLPKQGGNLMVVALCLIKEADQEGLGRVTQENLSGFILSHFAAVNELFQRFDLPIEDNELLSSQVTDYFSSG